MWWLRRNSYDGLWKESIFLDPHILCRNPPLKFFMCLESQQEYPKCQWFLGEEKFWRRESLSFPKIIQNAFRSVCRTSCLTVLCQSIWVLYILGICMHVWCVCMYAWSACMYVCFTSACMYACMNTCMHVWYVAVYGHTYIYTCIHMHTV
jgi:hypothetical protein